MNYILRLINSQIDLLSMDVCQKCFSKPPTTEKALHCEACQRSIWEGGVQEARRRRFFREGRGFKIRRKIQKNRLA